MIDLQTTIPVFAASDIIQPLHQLTAQLKAHPTYTQFFNTYRAMQADSDAPGDETVVLSTLAQMLASGQAGPYLRFW